MTAKTSARFIVVGGSMAGMFAGILLRRMGYEVDIYERAGEALASRGAGIATHRGLYAAFEQAGLKIDRAIGVESVGRIMFNPDGSVLGTHPMQQIMSSWGLLYRFIRREFPDAHYHQGANYTHHTQDEDGVTVHFEDGRVARGNWLIAADGLHSTVRNFALPDAQPTYAGYIAWRGLVDEAEVPQYVLDQVSNRMAFCLPEAEQVLGYLVAGPNDDLTPGKRWYNCVWYRTACLPGELEDVLTDESGKLHRLGIPHHLLRAEHGAKLRADAEHRIAPQFRDVVRRIARPFVQPIYDFLSPRMIDGRVLFIGDAASTARPHIGLGVSKAAEDAMTLAHAFERKDLALPDALTEWEAERQRYARAAVKHSARMGAYLGFPQTTDEGRHYAALYRQPEIFMSRVAAIDPERYLEY